MTKLVEESRDLLMLHQGWFTSMWLIKVSHHSCSRCHDLSIYLRSLKKREDSSVSIFVVSRMQIQIKLSQNLITSFIFHLIHFDILMPCWNSLKLGKLKSEQFLIDFHSLLLDLVDREIFSDLFTIHLLFFLHKLELLEVGDS